MSEPKAVPKFGSFKPKAPPQAPIPVNEKEKKRSSRDKDETGDRDKRRHYTHHHRHRSRSREKEGRVSRSETSHPPATTRAKSPDVFFIDRKGDEKNIAYGSIHRYDVPAFYRVGAGGVLGASSKLKIDRDHADDKGIVLYNWRESKFPRREKYVFSQVARERPHLLKIRPEVVEGPGDSSADFVSLDIARGKKRKRRGTGNIESSGSENDENHYRSIHGKSKGKSQPTDDALKYATDSESSGSEAGINVDADGSRRQTNIELNRRVEQNPHDIDAWLALIEHQDTLLRGQDDRRRVTNAEMRSMAEIKIHMYEKALEKPKTLSDRERLLLGLMAEGSKIWETKIQSDRWEQISKENIDSLMLWKSFLNFKQATFSTFQYEEIRDIFISRIKLLSKITSTASSDAVESIYQQLLYVMLRLTLFMRESGYSELAVAVWQSLLEVNFCAPKQAFSKEDRTRLFGDFWESEVARIGDDDARGWRHYVENPDVPEPEALIAEGDKTLDAANLFRNWATAERMRSKGSLLPARTMDDVVEDDPFRVILFADIEEFLIMLPPSSEALRTSLMNAFLLFCRLPPISTLNQPAQEVFIDASVEDELLESNSTWMRGAYDQKLISENGESDISSSLEVPLSAHQNSTDTLFSSKFWFKNMVPWRKRYASDPGPVSYTWVRNILKQITQTAFRTDIGEYHLAFEWRNEPDTIKKVSKGLLKQQPASLRLYNAYAMIEWARGNKDISNGVFSAALNMSKSMSEDGKRDSIVLWKSRIWASLEDLDKDSALQHLFAIADGAIADSVELSPTTLLKARQHLVSNRDHLISAGDVQYAIIYGECLALLEYLTATSSRETKSDSQGDITSALACYTALSKILIDRGLAHAPSHELLLQSAARLLYHHARIGPFRPALLREYLTQFIALFPRNTIFLSLYTWNESRLRIDNRVRNILLTTVLAPENDTLTSRLFAIYYEINQGTIHSARSAFEHAIASSTSKSSAGLWKFYMTYCLATPQFRALAKDIWYRALRACPWAKELYIFGFENLSDVVSFTELKRTWRVMGEKELRVHVDLEDRFEEMDELGLGSEKELKRVGSRQ